MGRIPNAPDYFPRMSPCPELDHLPKPSDLAHPSYLPVWWKFLAIVGFVVLVAIVHEVADVIATLNRGQGPHESRLDTVHWVSTYGDATRGVPMCRPLGQTIDAGTRCNVISDCFDSDNFDPQREVEVEPIEGRWRGQRVLLQRRFLRVP